MKKVRTAAVVAVVTTAVTKAREYAREHPEQAADTLDRVEAFVRGKAAHKHLGYIDKGSSALRQGLGLPARGTVRSTATSAASSAATAGDPDPDTSEPPVRHRPTDPVAPNPAPGTSDDPHPRRRDDDPAPLTPGERPHR